TPPEPPRRPADSQPAGGDVLAAVRTVLAAEPGDRALVVEDDPDTARLVAATLREHGFGVRAAANGREGLERLAEATPSVIILDLMMPTMDGFAFLEQVQLDPLWSRIPIVILTAKTLEPSQFARLSRLSAAIITKGRGDTEQIIDTIRRAARPRSPLPEGAP
ncbi:MAG TPA: response regulator, partial [Gemmataceae bacterium]|nr:response regulator [Gemmataceae bacterium]